MSSNDENEHTGNHKKRKFQRACDSCRRRKSDPSGETGGPCSNCRDRDLDCTYDGGPTKRVRNELKGHLQQLEVRLQRLTRLFQRLHPDLDLDLILEHDDTEILNADPSSLSKFHANPRDSTPDVKPNEQFFSALIQASVEPSATEEDPEMWEIMHDFRRLSMSASERNLYYGKSSSVALLQDAIDLKHELNGAPKIRVDAAEASSLFVNKRPEFWAIPSWLTSTQWLVSGVDGDPMQSPIPYQFPDDDLMAILIGHYFDQYNLFYPILHRSSFEKSMKEGLHLTHQAFGGIVLLVCAIGSRHCDDSRVFLDGVSDTMQSRGWKYFSQVRFVCNTVLYAPTLYDLQFYCLALEFLGGSPVSHSCWFLIGIAIRLAQEVGVHQWRKRSNIPSVEDESWKRAFWTLVSADRLASSMLGRSCAIAGDDLNLDLPSTLDDEYHEIASPVQSVEQSQHPRPKQRLSIIDSFNYSIRLAHILGTALRTIYCSNKSKAALGLLGEWEQPIIAQLDSNLNQWLETLPEHLRWDPSREDSVFFRQSAHLHCQFYYVQIVIHRPFLRTSSSLALTSMAAASFVSGVVLLLNLWTAKRSGLPTNQERDLADVRKAMDLQKRFEKWSPVSGRIWDVLNNLIAVDNLPSSSLNPAEGIKMASQPNGSSISEHQSQANEHQSQANEGPSAVPPLLSPPFPPPLHSPFAHRFTRSLPVTLRRLAPVSTV
ncbi:hypothetical protein ONZ45_g13227 [Pleurotus djamor]|nr:hypothetical protein ONZ45_g13227 [Pleurotus djamor]